ncbi:DNA-binding response regulator, NarL/FixJ family, containings REC and HTH domains [Nostoc flagelliforme CCNUN1]|uniref:histidine kinase n=1 Tax=Nostoc flagelliforme CCNUN1 TaxID=2038116 RepID=A0A2K8T574_9NOSO|nr:PAS domain S-box protein [Nostoc flagelliforme]AUB42733.1 DNA-binding response regulator, NarL/FixJ family, containings REC and HTH domains [Nostoc flagelliforme CCNUN1]
MQELKQLQEQQKLIGAIALDIRKSLKFQDILAKSVKEVRQLLKADRVLLYQFTHKMQGKVIAESVLPQWTPTLELEIEDTCFQQSQGEEYCQGKIWAATNIYEAGLSDRHIQFLEQFQVKANLVVPILLENQETPAVVWGLFIVHQCSAPRQWQTFEVELLNQLTVQLAIAIQQAQLHDNLETLKSELEAKVEERTTALQESDRRFRAIFDNTFQFTGLLTPDGILLEANQTVLSFGGLKLEDVINRPFWEAHWWTISPQIQEELKQAIARAAQGEFVRYEVDVLGANNRVATIDFSLRPLQNETGQVVLLIPEGRDITERKATELALSEREVMLYLIEDNLPNGAVYRVIRELDGSDRFSYLSGGIEKLTEVKAEDALRDSSLLYRQFLPEDILRLQAAVAESCLNLSVLDIQLRIRTPSGKLKWFHFRSTPRQLKNGRVAWDGLVVDVTDLKRSEEILRQSEERWQLAITGTDEGIWDWDISTNQTFRSERWFTILGYEPNELSDHDDEWSIRIHPDDYTRVMTAQKAYLLQQVADHNLEYRLRCKDGSYRWVRSRAKAIWNEQGNPVRLVGSLGDISERKQAEEKLQQSEAQLATTQQIAHVGSWEWNLETKKRCWSIETFRIFGLNPTQSEPTQAEFLQMLHPEDRELFQTNLEQALAQKTPFNIEYRIVRPNGSVRYLEGKAEIAYNPQGNAVKLFGSILDITQRKETELEIIRSRDLLEAVYNESADALFLVDVETLLTTDCNDQAVKLFAASSKAELINIEGHTLQKQQFTRDQLISITEEMNQQGFWSREIEYVTKQGNSFWGNIAAKQITVADNVMNLIRVTDITASKRVAEDRKQAEAALQESEARFQAFMNNSPVLAWITDADGRVLYSNQTYLRTFKLLPEQVIGQSIFDLYPDEIARQHFDQIQTVIQTNQVIEAIEVASRPDGTLGEFLVYKFPILGLSAQKLVGKVAIDITERKILERELAHKQKLLDTFINNAPVGITILDRQLRYSLINEALAEINGISAAAHIGKTLWEIVPDLAPRLEPIFQNVLTTGEAILDFEISGETPKLPGVIRTWLASYFPIQSEADQPISIGIVVVEISDRKRAEQMLELQAVITRNMAEGICLIHATDSVFVYANPKFEQMFGYEPGELIGQHVSIVNYGDEHTTPEEVYQAIRTVVLQHGEANYEVYNVKKDGTPFWCRANASIFEHPEYGSVVVAIQQDITEHKQTQEEIKASLKEKEVLLKEIHHRVKNNLGIVSSLLQMQCRRTEDPVVTAILRNSQNRIASIALVHEKLYRSEDLADIDFAQYIPDLTTHLFDSYNVSSSQIQLKIQVDNASLDIETAIPCGLIINELVSNALKYAFVGNRRGEIEVKFYQESESTLALIIRDNGIGLPENFDSKKAKTLGITLVQGLVKQLRGKLEIDSDHGTQFKITFTNSRA